jgi:hypothetical protein
MPSANFRKNLRDEKFAEGVSPYSGTLGPNPTADRSKGFASELNRTNVHADTFDSDGRTFWQEAPFAQQRLDMASMNPNPNFADPSDNGFAHQFLQSYRQGVQRGLIEPEREVRPDNLARMTTEYANQASMQSDPNTAGVFPGQSGTRIS